MKFESEQKDDNKHAEENFTDVCQSRQADDCTIQICNDVELSQFTKARLI